MSDPAGLALLAVFVLIFACLIPQLVVQRKLAAQARLQDLHSERTRMVTTSASDRQKARSVGPHTAPILPAPAWNTEGRSVMVRPPANARHAKVTVDIPAPIKLTRAEAARRRAIVALTLTALTAVGIALLVLQVLPPIAGWALAAVPAAALVATIVLGRRAAIANAKADAAYLGRLRQLQEERAHPRPVSEGKPFADLADADPKAPERAAVPDPSIGDVATGDAPVVPVETPSEYVASEVWTPVEVPKPSYVAKPKAPRWVPEPLAIADLEGQAEEGLSHTVLSTGQADGPVVQYTELDLDAIMERRRVV